MNTNTFLDALSRRPLGDCSSVSFAILAPICDVTIFFVRCAWISVKCLVISYFFHYSGPSGILGSVGKQNTA